MNDIAIKVENLTKSYPLYHHINSGIKTLLLNPKSLFSFFKESHYLAIENISFTVKKGESVALIGKNGAGKSTILSLLAGVLKPTKGCVTVNGKVAAMLELGGGFHHELTGRDNIILNGTLLGLTRKQINERIDDIISFSELGDFIEQPIRIYSSGMLAKLGFAIITSVDPDILIIDEILAVGDSNFQKKCLSVIDDFKKKGVTIFLVSHNMDDVIKFCDKAIWIEEHHLRMVGDSKVVVNDYLSV
ncbi:ABC transporter ATP-binding protein [Photobacterium leiognathi]|uniref:ABC transporter ATP-binding protein n=1 Tax=Photobacterium leiognathi TaxID=553611 RepID=UPI001EDF0EEB|nr:ABC transporter ATP-binding protein [Photobacterium leiognathi]MCG3886883.1 ABC transporter ATP-binding protein [Photobacterium leiognathi]